MLVTVHLSAELDARLRQQRLHTDSQGKAGKTNASTAKHAGKSQPSAVASSALQKLIAAHALAPEPLFETPLEPTFSGIWHMRVPERDADSILAELLRIPGVEAAYSKTEDALPEF
jgi:hypothetical protein